MKVAQSCPTLCDPIDYGILQARILEWVVFPFSRGSSQPKDQTQVLLHCGWFFTSWATREALVTFRTLCEVKETVYWSVRNSARCCYCSVTKSFPTLWDPMDCSMPGSSVLHYLLEFAHIHVRWVVMLSIPSSSATLFSFSLQSFPAPRSFPVSQLFISGGQIVKFIVRKYIGGCQGPAEVWGGGRGVGV